MRHKKMTSVSHAKHWRRSVRSVRSVCVKESKISVNKIFVLFVRLLPFGQWAYGESRVQKRYSRFLVKRSVRFVRSVCVN